MTNQTIDCRSGNFRCALGSQGCSFPQISGQPASHVWEAHQIEAKTTLPVPVLGPGQYDLMIVGELPSSEDDKTDMAWIDLSGQTIIDYLQKAGHNLDRVWMTKIVKCRPKVKGRKPSTGEIGTCRDEYLRKEIELIQPKVVMLVGAPTLKAFNITGKGSMNAIHGSVFEAKFPGWDESPTFKVIPTLNPSQFHYKPNPKLRARIAHDYVIAKQLLDGITVSDHFKPNYQVIDTPEKLAWLEEKLLSSTMFAWDTESCKLGWRKAPVITLQFAWGWNDDECAVVPIMQHDTNAPKEQTFHLKPGFGALNDKLLTGFLHRVFETPHIVKAAHNQKYDVNVLRHFYGIIVQGPLYDTWTMKHLQDENPPSDLKFLCDVEFAWGDYEAAVRAIVGSGKKLKATYDKVPDLILWLYGATDALGTYRLCCLYSQRLQAKPNLWNFHTVESEPVQIPLARAEFKGAMLDMDVVDALGVKFAEEQNKLLSDLKATISNPDFNPGSNDQVLAAFFQMGVPHVDLEEKAAVSGYSTDKKHLTDIVEGGKEPQATFARKVMEYRNRTKMIGTYIDNAKEDVDDDGRVRHSWVIAGPVTGRTSCRFFHQIPKVDESIVFDSSKVYLPFAQRKIQNLLVMRDMFIAPPGYKYVYGDFSQVELRILAIIANDQEMLRILADPKEDLHRATAFEFLKSVWADPKGPLTEAAISKENRTEVGKRVNFGLAYGSEGYALVKTGKWKDWNGQWRNFTWEMLEKGMATWKARFVGVGQFIDLTPDLVRGWGGIATNVFGRERHFGTLLTHPNDMERQAAEREAINYYIQSVAASITNRLIINIDRMLLGFGVPEDVVCLVNTVHDSVAYEVRDDHVEWFMGAMNQIGAIPYPELGGATFKLDMGVGQNWVDAECA